MGNISTEFIIALCILAVLAVGIIIYSIKTKKLNKDKVIEWLKWAVVEAEKLYGSKTGQLKLRTVYNWFVEKFPSIASYLPFAVFSTYVDVALDTVRVWLDTNPALNSYVTTEKPQVVEIVSTPLDEVKTATLESTESDCTDETCSTSVDSEETE